MAYIVLALGVLMALVGLGAMVTGYPVIEVERGWATVISGAVLLSGGLVTAALGIVVRQLVELKRGLRVPAIAAAPAEAALPIVPPLTPATAEAATPPVLAPTPPSREPRAAPSLPRAPAFAMAAPAAAIFAADELDHGFREPQADRAPVVADMPAPAAAPQPAAEPPAEAAPHEIADDVEPEYELPEHEHDQEQEQEHEARAETPAAEPEPPDETWLEQAFQAFDYEMEERHAGAAEEPLPEPPEAVEEPEVQDSAAVAREEPRPEPVAAPAHEPASHADETAPAAAVPAPPAPAALAPATAPEAAPSNLTVIGRYDSEGTSYVMYSDGSIEAQSDAGVYRFGSMAELKAFIEG